MSVGVCIINRNGIALAADSAGTFTRDRMFYNSMNKVFSLSQKYTYGAITCGQTSIYNVSIDQILKEFRVFLDESEGLKDFFDIIEFFTEFIKQKNDYYKFKNSESVACCSIIKNYVYDYGNKIKCAIEADGDSKKIDTIIDELEASILNAPALENYDVSQYIEKEYQIQYAELVKGIVPELEKYTDQFNRLWKLITECFNRSFVSETQNRICILFAGYGLNDAFPKYVNIDVYTVVGGNLKYTIIERYEESNNNAKIVPLAQPDVVLTFCRGISDAFISFIPQKVESMINTRIAALSSSFTKEQNEAINNSFSSFKDEIIKAIGDSIQNENVEPILKSVQLIPLPEMAFLAESLVNITSLKRTFSLDGFQQTVGGPTDVAVISKGDGFIWIKNKKVYKA